MNKRYSVLLWMLIATAVLVAALGAYLKYVVLKPLELYQQESVVAVPFLLLADEEAKYTIRLSNQEEYPEETNVPPAETESVEPTEEMIQPTEAVVEATEPVAEETEPVPVVVDESWFDDALFIGDSRTYGLSMYGSLGNAHYFSEVGMTVYNVQTVRRSSKNFSKTNLVGLLEKNTYGKIFIHLGLNEILGDRDKLLAKYQELVDLVREKQPDAVIVLQSIMTVTRSKAASDTHYSLENIQALNDGIKAMVEGDKMRYLDVNVWIADEEGYLPKDQSKDGCHLYGTGYQEWAKWYIEIAPSLEIE